MEEESVCADVNITTATIVTCVAQQPQSQEQSERTTTTTQGGSSAGQHPNVDVDKTLRDAEEFLVNFASLRAENEQLKQTNQQLEAKLEKARLDLQEIQREKEALENQILQEREQNKEVLWKLRSDFQRIQDERLEWKEKYLESCASHAQQPQHRGQKSATGHDYTPVSFPLSDDSQNSEEVILTLISEDAKSYKISIRECSYCGIGFCSAIGLNEHVRVCTKRHIIVNHDDQEMDSLYKDSLHGSNENSLDCEECNVKFPTHADLIQHNQFHQGTHKFLCRICNRAYQSNPGRLKHEQFEHGSLPLLQCDSCGKQFKRKDRLKDHIATKHSIATPHQCPYCNSAFKLRDYLRKHVNQYHPGKGLGLGGFRSSDSSEVITMTSRRDVNCSDDMPVDCRLSDLVESKFNDKTLTLTSFSIKSDREETVATVTSDAYNHIANQLNLNTVQTVVQVSDSEMTDAEEGRIVIDTGE